MVAALLQDSGCAEPAVRPQRVAQRGGPHSQQHVALTDGAAALQQQLVTHFSGYTLILDIIHATEYLWDTANALLGETHSQRPGYTRTLMAGQTEAVITALEAEMKDPTCTGTQRQAVRHTVSYYRRDQPYMHYDAYLARDWPIATGVVEGAYGHLVKDRMEQSGMRWTKTGAPVVLELRAVRINGHWERYWQFHRHPQHQRLDCRSTPVPALAEA